MTVINTGALDLAGFHTTNEVVPADLVIDLSTSTWKTIMRVVVPVEAGDLLDASAWMKATNDEGYNVGLGAHLWAYDCDPAPGPDGTVPSVAVRPWWRLDGEAGSVGENVTKDTHHITLAVAVPYVVPADWPAGHRIVIVLRADAHSTAWDKDGDGAAEDRLTVDPYGRLTVRRYTPRTEAL